VHEVVVAPTAVSRERLLDLHHMMSGFPDTHLRLSSGFFEILTTGVQVQDVGNVPLISMNRLRITGLDALLKTVVDYGLAILGVIIGSPILLILAMIVKVTSPGPIIHRRRVMGVGGKTFDAYKFRTMIADADNVLARMMKSDPDLAREYESGQKLKNDPRVTPVGHTLRKYSLDELPQIFNVLKGEMSLVGPRMISPAELKLYGAWGENLLTVKPGITGPWQVMGRNDLSYDERVRLSMQYIRNYSIWTDLKILLDTFMIVIKGKGAY
jgi:lipopolysaccharide/colanic/teichoic acid biosynthesis glycosyltransferase